MTYRIATSILQNGNLIITANNAARHELAKCWRNHRDWNRQWFDTIGPFQENGELFPVEPEDIAALTEAPILTDYLTIDDNGNRRILGRVWWFPDYMVRDPLEELRNKGRVEFTLAEESE